MQNLLFASTIPICNFPHLSCSSLGLFKPAKSSMVPLINWFSSEAFCLSLSRKSLKWMGFHCMLLFLKGSFREMILIWGLYFCWAHKYNVYYICISHAKYSFLSSKILGIIQKSFFLQITHAWTKKLKGVWYLFDNSVLSAKSHWESK